MVWGTLGSTAPRKEKCSSDGGIMCVQVLSTRKRKDVEVADIKVQVCLFAFDCLYLNGETLLQKPLTQRREAMHKAVAEKLGELQYAVYKVMHHPLTFLRHWYISNAAVQRKTRDRTP